MSIATAVAKLAALSVPAKATTVGIAVALGATGGVVAHATVNVPDPDGIADYVQEDVATDVDVDVDEPAADESGAGVSTLPEAASFGQSVAEDARDGGVIGPDVAEQARIRAEERRADAQAHAQAVRERARSEVGAVTPEIPEPRGRPEDPSQRP